MAKSRTQKRSKLQEKRIAEDIGGRVQPGSGSAWSAKSDVRVTHDLRVEAKYTEADYYTLKLDELLKIQDEALSGGAEEWVMQIELPLYHRRFAVTDFVTFKERQAQTGKPLFQSLFKMDKRSVRLPAKDLIQMSANAAANGGDWCYCLMFETDDGGVFSRVYALYDWDQFLYLRENFKR